MVLLSPHICYFTYFIFLGYWGLNSVLHLLGRCSITWAMTPALFALVTWDRIVYCLYSGGPELLSSCLCFLYSWYDRHLPAQLFFFFFNWWRWVCTNFSPGLASNFNPPSLHFLNSQDYRCELPRLAILSNFFSFCFLWYWSLNSVRAYTLSYSTSAVLWFSSFKHQQTPSFLLWEAPKFIFSNYFCKSWCCWGHGSSGRVLA
jgi:hypothetical protein